MTPRQKKDHALYRQLSEPFDTDAEAGQAIDAFLNAVEAARKEFRIADLLLMVHVNVKDGEEEVDRGGVMSMGDASRRLPMAAALYGHYKEEHEEYIARMAGERRQKGSNLSL